MLDGGPPCRGGDYEQATRYWHEALALSCEMADRRGIVWAFHQFAWVAAGQGRAERAVRLSSAAEALREASGASVPPGMERLSERTRDEARAALDQEAYAAAWAEGRAMSMEEGVRNALEEAGDG